MLGLSSDTASRLRTYSPHEFVAHCGTLASWHTRAARARSTTLGNPTVAGVPPGAEHSEALRAVYARYAVGPGQGRLVTEDDYTEPRMGGGQLQRLAQDLGLMQPNGGSLGCVLARAACGELQRLAQDLGGLVGVRVGA